MQRDLTKNPITRTERASTWKYGKHRCKNCDASLVNDGDIVTIFRQFWCWFVREPHTVNTSHDDGWII